MENIILFLALFSATAAAVQLSLFRTWWQRLALCLLIAGGTYLFYPTAITVSATYMEALLADESTMLTLSVILVLEAACMLILALFMLRDMYQALRFPWKLIPLAQFLPMPTSIAVLCYYQVHLYQQGFTGEFATTALLYGGCIALGLFASAWVIKLLIPLRVLRLELGLAMHAAQIALAIAISVLTATYPYRGSEIEPNLIQFAIVAVIFIIGSLTGYLRCRNQTQKLLARS